ncbi:MAG: sigma-54-dependent Fis family transcriptional regulator [Anaerolineae bacterium]|nr:sigma-54-dependent Fis family transcriptional regulator [Anaerolineae bacterium]
MSLTVLIVDDEENFRLNICDLLTNVGYEVVQASSLTEARAFLRKGVGEVILLDVQLPDGYGPDLMDEIAINPARPLVIMITGFGDIDMAVTAMKAGAHDFLTKPVNLERLEKSLMRASEIISMRRELEHFRHNQGQRFNFVVGKSPKMRDVLEKAKRAALASVSVLITGETGTGKEIVAKFIHDSGPRASKPFMPINSASIQPTMIESELFGYEAGAFTGAEKRKLGLMELADSGILFLDEISSMSMDMQSKLLRALEDRTIRRVGGGKQIPVDVQVLAASNKNVLRLIENGEFREDLYYRLHVVDLTIPPLRERKEDIPELVSFFLHEKNLQMGMNVEQVSENALAALQNYHWPGNIRELKNAIERALLFCDDEVIDLVHLPHEIIQSI